MVKPRRRVKLTPLGWLVLLLGIALTVLSHVVSPDGFWGYSSESAGLAVIGGLLIGWVAGSWLRDRGYL